MNRVLRDITGEPVTLPKPKRSDAEFQLQKAVWQHLMLYRRPKVLPFAVPNGEARSARTGAKLKSMGVVPGIPDIVIVIHGMAHGLELKADGGRPSEAQTAVEAQWNAAGGRYAVATGIDEALSILRRWGALPFVIEPAGRG